MPSTVEPTSTFTNNIGQHVFFRNWKSMEEPKGIILIVPGLNSHSGYYENFARRLTENNFEVYAIDLRGRGQSEGERYYVSDYKDLIADIDQLLDIAQSARPSVPVILLGHSAGGVFACVYAVLHQNKLQGLICEDFAFELPAPGFALATVKFLAHLIPHTRLIRLHNEDFSRDPFIVNTMNHDPLLADEKQPAKTIQQLLRAAEFLKKEMSDIKLPLLILHGSTDKVAKPSGSQYFLEHASSDDKQLKVYEGHYHDLLNDKDHEIVWKDIVDWLNERS